ncbi:MAG: hypothetical protein ACLFWG_00240 [Longimicrobiales bacterium]
MPEERLEDGTVVDSDSGEITPPPSVPMRHPEIGGPSAPDRSPPLIMQEPVSLREFLEGLATDEAIEEQQKLMEAYDRAVHALIGPNDVEEEGGRPFKRKSAWRKMARFFHLSTQVVSKEAGWSRVDGERTFVADVVVRAVAPWGQYTEALGSCSTEELRFRMAYPPCPTCGGRMFDNRKDDSWDNHFRCADDGTELQEGDYDPKLVGTRVPNPTALAKARHDCVATAETRATNRAVSNLVAAGEVSYEEVQGGDERAYGRSSSSGSPPSLDDRVGFGKEKRSLTWREVIEQDPGWARWAAEEADRTPDALREEILEALAEAGDGGEAESEPADPLDRKVGFGKHGDLTWRDLVYGWTEDGDRKSGTGYLRRYVLTDKCTQVPESLKDRLRSELDALRREIQSPGALLEKWTGFLDEAGATDQQVSAFFRHHPRLPDEVPEDEDLSPDVVAICVESVEGARGEGPQSKWARIVARLERLENGGGDTGGAQSDPPQSDGDGSSVGREPEPEGIRREERDRADKVTTFLAQTGKLSEEEAAAVEEAKDAGDRDALARAMEPLEARFWQIKGGGEGAGGSGPDLFSSGGGG